MTNALDIILKGLLIIVAVYILGRIFMKAGLHELDHYFTKKFNKHKQLKRKEDGTEKEEE